VSLRVYPYKIEVWERSWDETNSKWNEVRSAAIGGDQMSYPGKAFNINFA